MKARFCASELAGIEPTPPAPKGAGYVRLATSLSSRRYDFRYSSLDLPPLPADRNDFDVHVAINNDQVWIHSICLPVSTLLFVVIIVIIGFTCIIVLK